MNTNTAILDLINGGKHAFVPSLSVDCVIFGFHENQLKVLLLKHRHLNQWSLPGGFIYNHESADEAAYRVLMERTGLKEIFLHQFHTFGDSNRIFKDFHLSDLKRDGIDPPEDLWILKRFATIGYYSLVEYNNVTPSHDIFHENSTWWEIHQLPEMILDHRKIFDTALEALRLQLNLQPIGNELLPEEFTMPELQALYETILDKKLDRRNFQRKIVGFKILDRLEVPKKGMRHKSPYLYKFNLERYKNALAQGLNF